MATNRSSWFGVISWVYRALLYAYPPEFRKRFGSEPLQVFMDRCRERTSRSGLPELFLLALSDGSDVVIGAVRERLRSIRWGGVVCLVLALAFGLFAAFLDFQTDEVTVAAFVVLVGTFVAGVLRPAGAWKWALACGLCIFAAYELGPPIGIHPRYPADPGNYATLLALVPAFVGAYAGAILRRAATPVAA